MIYPNFETFNEISSEHTIIPVVKTLLADTETAVSAYLKIRDRSMHSFLLESVEGGEKLARYSFLGADPYMIFRSCGQSGSIRYLDTGREQRFTGDPIAELRTLMNKYRTVDFPDLPRFTGGGVGYFSYDAVRLVEDIPDTGRDDFDIDDIFFMFFDTILAFDNIRHTISIIANVRMDAPGSIKDLYQDALDRIEKLEGLLSRRIDHQAPHGGDTHDALPNMSRDDYMRHVDTCKEYIHAGDIIQVVLSQRFEREISAAPFDIYRMLRHVNPSPYMFHISTGSVDLVGASPEMLVRVEGDEVEVRPIAGTRKRGDNTEEDLQLADELAHDEKECAEHVMLLDLGRNDVGRVAEFGSVRVEDMMFIERYSHVMHMVSSVKGTLRPDRDRFDAMFSFFPAGTLTGAPKIRAMEIIDELEPTRRGIYGGAIGYVDYRGNLDSCITIRTIVVKNGKAYIQSGAGIVADSDPASEYQECVNKAKALNHAIDMAESGSLSPKNSEDC